MKIMFNDITITRIITAVPTNIVQNSNLDFDEKTKKKIIKMTGVEKRHILDTNESLLKLYLKGSELLFKDIDPLSIDALLVVTQTPEYRLPTTANLLHGLFGLKKEALAFDINQGCSGYLYGLSQAFSLLNTASDINRVLLIDADAISKVSHDQNKSTAFLFGDAASFTLCERKNDTSSAYFLLRSDGNGAKNLMIRDGGIAHPFNEKSLTPKIDAEGNTNTDGSLYMNGAEIFNFTAEEVPLLVEDLLTFSKSSKDDIEVFCLHQANKFMLQYLADKMEITERTPINIETYGNTSSVSIPLLICDRPETCLQSKVLIAGFGVGYSMGSALIDLSHTKTDLIEVP